MALAKIESAKTTNGRPIPLSYTRAKLFSMCPARFRAEYIDKIGEAAGIQKPMHLLIGTLLHEVADRYHKHLVATHRSTDYEAIDVVFEEVWKNREE